MEHLPEFILSVLVIAVGGFNAWQNVNIKLAISELRNELTGRVYENELKIASIQSGGGRRPSREWHQ